MRKTGNIILLLAGGIFCLFASPQTAVSQDATVEAFVSENQLYTGERVSLTIEITGGGTRGINPPAPPDIPELHLINPNPSTSTSFSLINGVSTTKYAYTYSYIALLDGEYTFPPMEVTVAGRTYRTAPIKINILDRNAAAASPERESLPDVFVRLEVSDRRPVVGQQIIADLVLYFKDTIEVISFQPATGWRTDGFWKENLSDGNQPRAESTLMNGVRYRKAVLTRHALFPGRADRLELSAYKVSANLRYSARYRDSFSGVFGSLGRNQRTLELETEPVHINVQPLPQTNTNFTGAVGQFEITRVLNAKEITIGEPLEVITRIEGIGNVPLINPPVYSLPDGFENYKPQESMNFSTAMGKIQGHKLFSNVMIARRTGEFTLPEASLSYYDDRTKRYVNKVLPALKITVKGDPNMVYSYVQDSRLTLAPVTGAVVWGMGGDEERGSRWWLWAGILFPVLLSVLVLGYITHQKNRQTNPAQTRSRNAFTRAKQRLQLAGQCDGDFKGGYANIYRAITGYIADRLQLPETGQSDAYYLQQLEQQGIDAETIRKCKKILDHCSSIRYAPDTTRSSLDKDIENARIVLTQLKKQF